MLMDMETQIHILEQEAYIAVLRAFKAQADAITWDKEALITELRKELRVSDDEHRELLSRVNGDDIIQKIREWRQAGGSQHARFVTPQLSQDAIPSPTVSGSRKKQKTNRGGQSFPGLSAAKSKQYPPAVSSVSRHFSNFGSSGSVLANEHVDLTSPETLIGRKVWTRWPEDNNFYEALITDYNPAEGRHALVYDISSENETWEWVNLKEISAEDIRWDGGDGRNAYGGGGRGRKSGGRGRGSIRSQGTRRDIPLSHNGIFRRNVEDISLLNTEALVEEVEKIFLASQPDPFELDNAKKMLQEHEQALVDAIARLTDASDVESDGEQQNTLGQQSVVH